MLRAILFTLGLCALAVPAWSADKPPYSLPKGTAPLLCTATPFGKRITLGVDHEVLVTRRQINGTLVNYQFTGQANSVAQREGVLSGEFASNTRFDTVRVDLDGKGRQELATAVIRGDNLVSVTVVQPSATAGVNEKTATWSVQPPATGVTALALDIASGDLDGSTDGKEELVVAVRYSNGTVRIFALSGDGAGAIAQADGASLGSWTMPAGEATNTADLAIAVGDALLEGRDQVVLLTVFEGSNYRFSVLRFEDVDSPGGPGVRFTHRSFTQSAPPRSGTTSRLQIDLADLGGSAAEEIVIHDQVVATSGQNLQNIVQTLRYFDTDRVNNVITDFRLEPTFGLVNTINSTDNRFAAAVGEIDRRPDQEIVVARSTGGDSGNRAMLVEVYKATFNDLGFPAAIGPAVGFAVASTALETDRPQQIEVAIGDGDRDGIGDVYLAFRDNAAGGGAVITKLRRFGLTRPSNPSAFPTGNTFAQTGQFNFPANFADTTALQVQAADWDNDSLLANLGSTCRTVREPMVRALIRHPPYWSRLQGSSGGFDAALGSTRTSGTVLESRYDTFTSHDVSGYVGVQAGGEFLGIGASVTAKVTAGYNYESRKGEQRTSEISDEVGQSQNQDTGGGLLVIEENTFNCYEYDVVRNEAVVADSNVRACEVVRRNIGNDALRAFIASDPTTWDTTTASSGGPGGTPSQWVPLNPEWASLALFRAATANAGTGGTQLLRATDGQYGTVMQTGTAVQPYIEIDLGEVRDIANVRVFPDPQAKASLVGATLFLSETAFGGAAPPSGAAVRSFPPDPDLDNGADRWNVWTRSSTAPNAPLKARYIRLQHTENVSRSLRVAEIQVFGEVHNQPPTYPLSVCDPTASDGLFRARVVDNNAQPRVYRNIDMRGDLQWIGFPSDTNCGANHAGVRSFPIWDQIAIGGGSGTGSNSWDLSNFSFNAQTDILSVSHSTRVGAEVEAEAGAVVQAVVGGAYEWATGVTEENSTTLYWGEGINYGGTVPGFSGAAQCQYKPQPFGYVTADRANVGYEHRFKVIDYVVRDFNWDRINNPPPASCFPERPDTIFRGDFEPAAP